MAQPPSIGSELVVAEIGASAAVASAGMVLADAGAHVTVVERPGGSPLRALPAFSLWSRGKHSLELDLASDAGRGERPCSSGWPMPTSCSSASNPRRIGRSSCVLGERPKTQLERPIRPSLLECSVAQQPPFHWLLPRSTGLTPSRLPRFAGRQALSPGWGVA